MNSIGTPDPRQAAAAKLAGIGDDRGFARDVHHEAVQLRDWRVCSELLNLWCGEGDLNPHEIAPASTSS